MTGWLICALVHRCHSCLVSSLRHRRLVCRRCLALLDLSPHLFACDRRLQARSPKKNLRHLWSHAERCCWTGAHSWSLEDHVGSRGIDLCLRQRLLFGVYAGVIIALRAGAAAHELRNYLVLTTHYSLLNLLNLLNLLTTCYFLLLLPLLLLRLLLLLLLLLLLRRRRRLLLLLYYFTTCLLTTNY